MTARTRTNAVDWAILATGLVGALLYAILTTRNASVPYEDAAMLLRYAQHLADGQGLAWNAGGPPVDGATDFLYTLAVGGVTAIGFSVETAARGLDHIAHLVTIAVVYLAIRRVWGAPRWMGIVSILYLATGPVVSYVAAYFGTPFYAMFVALSWYAASAILVRGPTTRRALAFAGFALAMALTRPDGVVMAGAIVIAILAADWVREGSLSAAVRRSVPVIAWTAAIFLVIGGAYFAWHWAHYGHPLPNPFYVKRESGLSGFGWSARDAFKIAGPFAILLLFAFKSRATAWIGVAGLVPIGIFVAVWGLISQDTNFAGRFQYAILPIALITWPAAVDGPWREVVLPRLQRLRMRPVLALACAAVVAIVALAGLVRQSRAWGADTVKSDGRVDVAKALRPFAGRGYSIATTEAGLLPLYSDWRAVDAWGLNDERVAHDGIISAAYLDQQRPAVIMFHSFFSPRTRPGREHAPGSAHYDWDAMVQTLKYYAETRHYVLAAAFTPDPGQAHYYYVRRDLPDRDALVRAIRSKPYDWLGTGRPVPDLSRATAQSARGSG